jgi:hypothetical protein
MIIPHGNIPTPASGNNRIGRSVYRKISMELITNRRFIPPKIIYIGLTTSPRVVLIPNFVRRGRSRIYAISTIRIIAPHMHINSLIGNGEEGDETTTIPI